jgi:hypothetical protein
LRHRAGRSYDQFVYDPLNPAPSKRTFAATRWYVLVLLTSVYAMNIADRFMISTLWIFIPLSYCTFGPVFALVQNLVPAEMRSQAVALLLFFSNIANLVVAPQLVGTVSDALAPRFGAESLHLALLPLTLCGFWAAVHFWIVVRRTCTSAETCGTPRAAGG